jgi:hypothetical protein
VVAVLARVGCGSRVYHLWYVYMQLALYLAIPLLRPLAAQATPTLRWYASTSGCYGIYLFHPLLLDVLGSGVFGVRSTSASLPPFVGIPALAAGLLFVSLGEMTVARRVPVVGSLMARRSNARRRRRTGLVEEPLALPPQHKVAIDHAAHDGRGKGVASPFRREPARPLELIERGADSTEVEPRCASEAIGRHTILEDSGRR